MEKGSNLILGMICWFEWLLARARRMDNFGQGVR